MKAITLHQPRASLMVRKWETGPHRGRFCKKFETRSRPWNHQGWVAIQSAKEYPRGTLDKIMSEPFFSAFGQPGHGIGGSIIDLTPLLPAGVILGIGKMEICLPSKLACKHPHMTDEEFQFGDYSTGRYAYFFSEMYPLANPIPAKGKQGIWNWTPPIDEELFINKLIAPEK